jgi:hypothetical protein
MIGSKYLALQAGPVCTGTAREDCEWAKRLSESFSALFNKDIAIPTLPEASISGPFPSGPPDGKGRSRRH